DQLAPAADLHAGDAQVPALDDAPAAQRELERPAVVPRRVELLAGRERDAHVMDTDVLTGLGLGAGARGQVVDLQVGGRVASGEVDFGLFECHEVLLLRVVVDETDEERTRRLYALGIWSSFMVALSPDDILLTGRVAVVTGAARGI